MAENVLAPSGFCCASYAECLHSIRLGNRFFEGQLSHVGHRYDLLLDGKPLRILVVGQEYGMAAPGGGQAEWRGVSLAERHELIVNGSGLACRYYAQEGFRGRNPHMRGTTSALRVVLGKGLGSDWCDEFVETAGGDRFHIFDGFALVNVLLCSAGPPNSSTGASTPTMRRNCLRHFAATLDVLDPTLVILQGVNVRKWIDPLLDVRRRLDRHLVDAYVGRSRALVCEFSHPSAHGALRWGDKLDRDYLVGVVEPTIRRAVAELAA